MTSKDVKHGDGTECVISLVDLSSEGFDVNCVTNNTAISKYFNSDFNGSLSIGNAETVLDRSFEKILQSLDEGMEYKMKLVINNSIISTDQEGILHFTLKFIQVIQNSSQVLWSDDQKIQRVTYLKEKGVILFKLGRYEDSFFLFSGALKLLLLMDNLKDSDVKKLLLSLYSNLCLCHIKKKNYEHVISLATDALEDDGGHVKILYHKGCSEIELGKYEDARDTFKKALNLDPRNGEVLKKLNLLTTKESESFCNMQGLKKMFG